MRADRVEDARQHGRVDRPMAAETVIVLGFDAPLRRPLEDAVHVREALGRALWQWALVHAAY